jgi:hypothetical protein
VIRVEAQLHGYSHGHELLEASMGLPKSDQALVDRLSDVAGPLRSGETFQPYLSTYPLPSGDWSVLARTWPDNTVNRPGCVRTHSLLIPTDDWSRSASLLPFLALLAMPTPPSVARSHSLPVPQATALPAAPLFSSNELLEALFLEENRPVALFDAPEPELIAVRLLSAMWPAMRRRFSLSTFALSPRRIEGRDFNLVFAPKSARQKFADWTGRRVDGGARALARHRWTDSIVDRVFAAPLPRLLDEAELQSSGMEEDSTGALLRISLLWDELSERLESTPSAALGLLDIARTRPSLSPSAEMMLREAISGAAHRALRQLSAEDAWDFYGAMARKLRGTVLEKELPSLQKAVNALASIDPVGAMALLAGDSQAESLSGLVAPIAYGVAAGLNRVPEGTFGRLPTTTLAQLVGQAQPLARAVATSTRFQQELEGVSEKLEREGSSPSDVQGAATYAVLRDALLPHLTEDFQAPLAIRFIKTLDGDALVRMVHGLVNANDFSARSLVAPTVERARALEALEQVRRQMLAVADPLRCRELVRCSLEPRAEDIDWLLGGDIDGRISDSLLVELLISADDRQLSELLRKSDVGSKILERIPPTAGDLLLRVLVNGDLPLDQHVWTAEKALQNSGHQAGVEIAFSALERCLRNRFSGNEAQMVARFLSVVAPVLNPKWVISHGIDGNLGGNLIGRNLIAFDLCEPTARSKIVSAVDTLASAFEGRWNVDLDHDGAQACANLFWSAAQQGAPGLLFACKRLLPKLLRSKNWPVSSIIAATFPVVYRELASHDEVPDILKIIPIFAWDKCRSARRELVDAFTSARAWNASDFALTACLCPHTERFLRRTARTYGGGRLLDEIERHLEQLPEAYREPVMEGVRDARTWS